VIGTSEIQSDLLVCGIHKIVDWVDASARACVATSRTHSGRESLTGRVVDIVALTFAHLARSNTNLTDRVSKNTYPVSRPEDEQFRLRLVTYQPSSRPQ
jgi:hypothetical protein